MGRERGVGEREGESERRKRLIDRERKENRLKAIERGTNNISLTEPQTFYPLCLCVHHCDYPSHDNKKTTSCRHVFDIIHTPYPKILAQVSHSTRLCRCRRSVIDPNSPSPHRSQQTTLFHHIYYMMWLGERCDDDITLSTDSIDSGWKKERA